MFMSSLFGKQGECSGGSMDDEVDIEFNHLDQSKLPSMEIKVHADGTARIVMRGRPIPSLTADFDNVCFAKRAILNWYKAMNKTKVVETIQVGTSSKPKSTPPSQSPPDLPDPPETPKPRYSSYNV